MRSPLIVAALLVFLFFAPAVVCAQEVGFLDLANVEVRDFSRADTSGVGSSICGGCGDCQKPTVPEIELSIVSTDSSRIQVGEQLEYVIRLRNIGMMKVRIPWTPNGADVEKIGNSGYVYSELQPYLDLEMAVPEKDALMYSDSLFGPALYSTSDISSFYKTMSPGQWVDIRFKVPYHTGHTRLDEMLHKNGQLEFKASARVLFLDKVYQPKTENSSASVSSACRNDIRFISVGSRTLTVLPDSRKPQ